MNTSLHHDPAAFEQRLAQVSTLANSCYFAGVPIGKSAAQPTWIAALLCLVLVAMPWVAAAQSNLFPTVEPATPVAPRDFYNAGTQKLAQGKLREAEGLLETALVSQSERVQSPALYNLGEVRFQQGVEEIKKGPAAGPAAARGRAAAQMADQASRRADDALGGNDLQNLVNAYMSGRGARRELKAATQAVKRALEVHGAALRKWQRSSGDFKSAVELQPRNTDARTNAAIVDRYIARLVDSLQELQQAANAMGDKQKELGEKMKQLKGRIPAEDMPPGAAGDDEEEEDQPLGPKPGEQEGATREGEQQQMSMSPEEAAWLLEGFKLGGDRRLPMGQSEEGQPRDRNRPTW